MPPPAAKRCSSASITAPCSAPRRWPPRPAPSPTRSSPASARESSGSTSGSDAGPGAWSGPASELRSGPQQVLQVIVLPADPGAQEERALLERVVVAADHVEVRVE